MQSEHSGTYLFLGILVLAGVLTALIFLPELNAIVLGVCLAVLFHPWYQKLDGALKGRGKGGAAAACMVLLAVIFIFVPIIFFGFEIFFEAQGLYSRLSSSGAAPGAIDAFTQALHRIAPGVDINISSYVEQGLGLFVNALGPIVSGFMSIIATFILSFFALYYFLRDGKTLRDMVVERSPFERTQTEEVLSHLERTVSSIMQGTVLMAGAYGILAGVGMFVYGIPSAILWGGITGIASFIPNVGVILVMGPGIIYLALTGHVGAAIGLTAWFFAMSGFVEAVLRPHIMGRRAKIHPMLLLFAVIGGLSFFGPIGILLGPLVLGVFLALLEAYPFLALKNLKEK